MLNITLLLTFHVFCGIGIVGILLQDKVEIKVGFIAFLKENLHTILLWPLLLFLYGVLTCIFLYDDLGM